MHLRLHSLSSFLSLHPYLYRKKCVQILIEAVRVRGRAELEKRMFSQNLNSFLLATGWSNAQNICFNTKEHLHVFPSKTPELTRPKSDLRASNDIDFLRDRSLCTNDAPGIINYREGLQAPVPTPPSPQNTLFKDN